RGRSCRRRARAARPEASPASAAPRGRNASPRSSSCSYAPPPLNVVVDLSGKRGVEGGRLGAEGSFRVVGRGHALLAKPYEVVLVVQVERPYELAGRGGDERRLKGRLDGIQVPGAAAHLLAHLGGDLVERHPVLSDAEGDLARHAEVGNRSGLALEA